MCENNRTQDIWYLCALSNERLHAVMTNPTPDFDTSGQATPPIPNKQGTEGGGGGPLAGLRQWLIDSYRGLYKIVLEPSMPRRYQVYLIILGAILGLIWAWVVYPAQFTGANPNRLNQAAQEQWIKMVAVSVSPGINYNQQAAADLLSRIPDPMGTINRMLADPNINTSDATALQNLQTIIPPDLAGTSAPGQNALLWSIVQIVLLIVLIGVITPIWMLLWRILIYPNIVAGIVDWFKQRTNAEYREQKQKQAQAQAVARAAADAKRSMVIEADETLGEPVMKTLSIFDAGREYDDSFEIELPLDQGGDFLGQCGATVAESVAPDPVAVELWLFDMFTQQDKKRVFITEAGFNDPSIRGRIEASLDSPADLVVAENGVKLVVDSDKLRLQGEMKDLQVSDNGRFQHFQMRVAAWRKDAATAGAPAGGFAAPPPAPSGAPDMSTYDDILFDPPPAPPSGAPEMSVYDDIQFDPPPQMPSQPQPLQPPPLQPPPAQPLQPPPLQQSTRSNPPPEDDPFGGTGDFTPLGND
jgi:hypothetical protein